LIESLPEIKFKSASMAHLTKAQLVSKICGDDLETQSVLLKQPKEELLAIYRDSLMMFSSDEEGGAENAEAETSVEVDLGNVVVVDTAVNPVAPVQMTSQAPQKSASSRKSGKEVSSSSRNNVTLNESNALMTSDGHNVAELSDEDLYARLKEFGVDVGPIVDSTRHLYQKKLAILIRGDDAVSSPSSADQTDSNGHDYDETTNGLNGSTSAAAAATAATPAAKNGLDQYSADEDTEDGEDEAQPEAVVRKTPTKSSSKRSSASSKKAQSLADKASELRQRFAGNSTREEERFTPTPRRSIHSYKVTEMSRETMVKTPDGIVTRDVEYTKSTSDSLDTAKNIRQRMLYWAPRVILGFIVACVVFYGYQSSVIVK